MDEVSEEHAWREAMHVYTGIIMLEGGGDTAS